jgi:hypothetical protein
LFIGLALAFRHVIQTWDLRLITVLVAIPILLLSSTLALAFPQEVPSAARSYLVSPLVFLLSASGLMAVRHLVARAVCPAASAVVIAVLMLLVTAENNGLVQEYDLRYRATVPNSIEIAHTVQEAEQELGITQDQVFLLGTSHWLDHRNVAFELGDIGWAETNHLTVLTPLPLLGPESPSLFVFNLGDKARIAQLWQRWPDGTGAVALSSRPGKAFGLFFVNVDLGSIQVLNGLPVIRLHSPCARYGTMISPVSCLQPFV